MTVITVQVGQCGNQLGFQFFNEISNEIQRKGSLSCSHIAQSSVYTPLIEHERFFRFNSKNELIARVVLADTEPKVIHQIQSLAKSKGKWSYDPANISCQRQGAGNNWAYGYYRHGLHIKATILEQLRTEIEKTDYLNGFLVLMSFAGGTGSGVGALITEAIREAFPSSNIFNQVVWPFSSGEVTVQNYNAILSLGHLQEASDAICVLQNDHLHKYCIQNQPRNQSVSLQQMNMIAARQMASFYLPSFDGYKETNFADLLLKLGAHPNFKLVSSISVPQEGESSAEYNCETWSSLLKMLHRKAGQKISMNGLTLNKFISNLLILRGSESSAIDGSTFQSFRYANWMPETDRFALFHHQVPLFKLSKSAVLVSNCQMILPTLDAIVSKAWNMFNAKAYLHHYYKYGLDEDIFMKCFNTAEEIVAKYKNLD